MNIFNNKEIRYMVFFLLMVSLVMVLVSKVVSINISIVIILLTIIYLFAFLFIILLRNRKISILSSKIDKLLHGNNNINFNDYTEGELSVLGNELSKMTIRLKNQTELLYKDKIFLSNSIADISHQIRTPLTSINLVVGMLKKSNVTIERKNELMSDLCKLTAQIEWQINTLLKLSKLDANTIMLKKENIRVDDLINECREQFEIIMDIKCQEFRMVNLDNQKFIGDKEWTKEAISNIIKNCIEHTDEDGVITIEVRENSVFTEIIIKDNGKGICKEDIPHIFERFYKGKNSSNDSVGIGLSLSKAIIIKQNGTIKVENSTNAKGAKFTIRFYKSVV